MHRLPYDKYNYMIIRVTLKKPLRNATKLKNFTLCIKVIANH